MRFDHDGHHDHNHHLHHHHDPSHGPFGRGIRDERGRGGRSGRGGRVRRGDVRAAILALLQERHMHGYEMLQELAHRTNDLWQPSPGSLYPALQLLEDQGLVRSSSADGRRSFELTDEGRRELAAHPGPAPWEAVVTEAGPQAMTLRTSMRQLQMAVHQLAQAGTDEQHTKADQLIGELRRQIYLLLAEAPTGGK